MKLSTLDIILVIVAILEVILALVMIFTAPRSPQDEGYLTKEEFLKEKVELMQWAVNVNLGFWALNSLTMGFLSWFFSRRGSEVLEY